MKRSLFLKQFIIYIAIILVSYITLLVLISNSLGDYFVQQKKEQLIKQGERIEKQYSFAFITGIIDVDKINLELDILEQFLNASTIFVDSAGRVVIVSSQIDTDWIGKFLNVDIINKTLGGEITSVEGRFGELLDEPVLTVGYPIKVDNEVISAIFMNVSMPEIRNTTSEVYRIIMLSLILTAITTFIIMYFSIKRISKPLIKMNEAAKVISGGMFHLKIKIDSQDEVGQLAKSFNEMAESLNDIETNKSVFISNISHDLRTPLTSIQGFVSAILDGTIEEKDYIKYLKIVDSEAKRLIMLSNNILDLNSFGLKEITLDISSFDINEQIKECVNRFESHIIKKEIEINLVFEYSEIFVDADKEKIRRVLVNILDNAIKFTEKNKRIFIETTITGQKAFITVKDEGIGISEEETKLIFDRFYKSDASRGMDKTGSGIGLSIVKEFINAHNETIIVKSKQGEGTEIKFSLSVTNT